MLLGDLVVKVSNNNCWSKTTRERILHVIRVCVGAVTRAKGNLIDVGGFNFGRADLVSSSFLLVEVFRYNFSDCALEVQGSLLHLRVEETIDKDTGVEILLRVDAQILVLGHDTLVHVADELKLLISSILVSVDFVAHHGLGGTHGSEALHEEKVWTVMLWSARIWGHRSWPLREYTHETLQEALGQK